MKDEIEKEYERAITQACAAGDQLRAIELSVGLTQYRKYYKVPDDE